MSVLGLRMGQLINLDGGCCLISGVASSDCFHICGLEVYSSKREVKNIVTFSGFSLLVIFRKKCAGSSRLCRFCQQKQHFDNILTETDFFVTYFEWNLFHVGLRHVQRFYCHGTDVQFLCDPFSAKPIFQARHWKVSLSSVFHSLITCRFTHIKDQFKVSDSYLQIVFLLFLLFWLDPGLHLDLKAWICEA